jgi:hypothetical protein
VVALGNGDAGLAAAAVEAGLSTRDVVAVEAGWAGVHQAGVACAAPGQVVEPGRVLVRGP